MKKHLQNFIKQIKEEKIDIYNEFGIQFELALFLRNLQEFKGYKIELERPINHFGIKKSQSIPKKEIDLCIYKENQFLAAVEIKVSKNGQVPLQLYKFCEDICFLEQLMQGQFESAYALVLVNSDTFYQSKHKNDGIYSYFRGDNTRSINGKITCPTGKDRGSSINIANEYKVVWHELVDKWKFYLLEVEKP